MRLKQDPFAQFGKISKGDEIPTTKDPNKTRPVDLDYFRFQFTEGNEWLTDELALIVGDKPRTLDVILMQVFAQYDPLESVFPHSMQSWNATRLQVECDAETITRRWDERTQSYDATGHKCQMKEDGTCPLQCKWTGRLKVIIPALIPVAGVGYFTFTTHGKRDIEQIAGAIQFMLDRDKPMETILWKMLRTAATSNYKDVQGVARTREYYPVTLTVKNLNSEWYFSGNPTSAPALPPVTPRADVYEGEGDEDVMPPYDKTPALAPVKTVGGNGKYPTQGMAMNIIRQLREHHRAHSEGVNISDILFTLGLKDLDELAGAWANQHTTLTQDEYAKVIVDAFVNANNVQF
jgi:hypothetical protein